MRLELFTVTLLFSYIPVSSATVYATSDLGMSKLDQVPPQPRSSDISQKYIICFHSVSVLEKIYFMDNCICNDCLQYPM